MNQKTRVVYFVEHKKINTVYSSMLPRSETYKPSKNYIPIRPIFHLSGCQRPHLTDILVPHPANLLNVGSRLRNVLERVAVEGNLVLDVG